MPKKAEVLPAIAISHLKEPGCYLVGGVAGLGLQIVSSLAKSWVVRVMVGGRRRKMGLGGFPDVLVLRAHEIALFVVV